MRRPAPPDVAQTLIEGPWRHRMVPANGARFHIAEAGEGPLVILLHGFAQFWWAWRDQLEPLAKAGYHAVAMDMRGYGASDKPPRGYDPATLAADVAGVVRALGQSDAVIVGHDWGAWIAWSMPSLQPDQTRAIVTISMPHPLTFYSEIAKAHAPAAAAKLLGYQMPWIPQRRLTRDGAIAALMQRWWGEGSPDPSAIDRYTAAIRLPSVSATSLNGLRGAVRGGARRESRMFRDALEKPVTVPVLQIHGAKDSWIRPGSALASRSRVTGPYRSRIIPGAGHLVPEEAPARVTAELIDWLTMLDGPTTRGGETTTSLPDATAGADGLLG